MSGRVDVAVVGGGPAGLAVAIAGRLAGLAVTVLERAPRAPIDKACGEGLMPEAVTALAALGVDLPAAAARPFRGIRYRDGDRVAEGRFAGAAHGLGVRRTRLHAALVERAGALGVEMRWGCPAHGLVADGLATATGPLPARFVIGADGLRSAVRRWAGLAGRPARRRRFGVRRHYRLCPWTDLVEVHWGPGCEAYVTPVGDEEVGVALLWAGKARGFAELLPRLPGLAERLADAPRLSADRGAGPFEQRSLEVVADGRIALVGDAAGYLDAITGEGLALALGGARDLAACLAAGDLAPYPRQHRRRARWPVALTRLALFAGAHPRLRRRAIAALGRDPELFSRLLGLATGGRRPGELGLGRTLRFVSALAHP